MRNGEMHGGWGQRDQGNTVCYFSHKHKWHPVTVRFDKIAEQRRIDVSKAMPKLI